MAWFILLHGAFLFYLAVNQEKVVDVKRFRKAWYWFVLVFFLRAAHSLLIMKIDVLGIIPAELFCTAMSLTHILNALIVKKYDANREVI